jgi:hypothetical protein
MLEFGSGKPGRVTSVKEIRTVQVQEFVPTYIFIENDNYVLRHWK